MKLSVEREVLSPAQATAYLEGNLGNRPLVEKRVLALAGAISRGEWKENAETIKFNGGGSLLDGQHRLAAIARGRRSVPVWIARGLEGEAQETVDIGASRTVGNMLAIRGYKNANEIAGAARIIWTYRQTKELYPATAGMLNPTPQQIIQVIEQESDLSEWVTWAGSVARKDPALRLSKTVIAGTGFVLASKTSEEDAKGFFAELLTPLHAGDATAVLRTRLLQQGFHNQMHPRLRLALVVKAFNAWMSGERPKRLTWRAGGAKKEPFPSVIDKNEVIAED